MTGDTEMQPGVPRRVAATLLLVGLWPVTVFLCAVAGMWSADFLADHGIFHWASSLGDIGEALLLLFGGMGVASAGYVVGIALASIADRQASWIVTGGMLGIPFVVLISSMFSLTFERASFHDAAVTILCTEYFLAVLMGSLARGVFHRVYGSSILDSQAQPTGLLVQLKKKPWLLAATIPCIISGSLLVLLYIVHSHDSAVKERACIECMKTILEAEDEYFRLNGKFANKEELYEFRPEVEKAIAATKEYSVEFSLGSPYIYAIPRGGKRWMSRFVLSRSHEESYYTRDRQFVPVLVLTRERGSGEDVTEEMLMKRTIRPNTAGESKDGR